MQGVVEDAIVEEEVGLEIEEGILLVAEDAGAVGLIP